MVKTDIKPIVTEASSINLTDIKDKNNSKNNLNLLFEYLKSPFSKKGFSNLINIGKNI